MAFTVRNFRHGRLTRVLADGSNLSAYLKEASISMTMDVPEATAFSDALKQWVTGLPDASATLSGMFDATESVGLDSILAAKFGKADTYLQMVIANEGLSVNTIGRRARAFQGILTSYNLQNTVADLVSLNMDMKVLGEMYVMQTLNAFDNDPLVGATGSKVFDRQTIFGATSKYGGTFTGFFYVMVRNTGNTVANFITKNDSSSTPTTTVAPAVILSGTAGASNSVDVPVGGVGVWITPSASVGRYVSVSLASGQAAINYPFLIGLVDPTLSLLAS